jgi:serine/threonine-protein kinase
MKVDPHGTTFRAVDSLPPSLPPTTLAEPHRDEIWYEEDARDSGVRQRPTDPNLEAAGDAPRASDIELLELDSEGHGPELGAYRLIERIGSGAMGHVFRAQHRLLGRMVAIKMLRPELMSDEACVHRFLAEARAVNLIGHENIIDVTDFARTPSGQPWFVMEMLEGSDLGAALLQEPMVVSRALEIARQLCDALAAVHTAGIVHRDVKPENTFLTHVDGKDFVKLLDFGIARLPDPTSPDPLQEGLVGTPQYMAPEQVSASAIDHRADLYAFGSLLYELLTGRTPFRGTEMQELLAQVLLDTPVAPSALVELPDAIRVELDDLVLRCLAKKASERPSSAREIAEELAAILAKLHAAEAPSVASPLPSEVPAVQSVPAAASYPFTTTSSDDAVVEEDPALVRKRARQLRHAQRVWSSRSATLLAAVAAAAAMWIATSERSWAHAAFWSAGEESAAAPQASVHVVHPAVPATMAKKAAYTVQEAAADTVFVAATPSAPVLAATAPSAPSSDVEVAKAALDRDPTEKLRAQRRAQRAKARAERAERAARPALVITPSPVTDTAPTDTAPTTALPPAPPALDRDLVLNPFAE